MLDLRPQTSRSKASRLLVKQKVISNSKLKTKSIFSLEKQHGAQDLDYLKKDSSEINPFDVCGDQVFKKQFLSNIKTLRTRKQQNFFHEEPERNLNQDLTSSNLIENKISFSERTKKQKQTVYMNSTHNNNFFSKLNKTQRNLLNRQNSSLQKFTEIKQKWQKIDSYLKLRIPKSQTVTFGSVSKIYIHENPEKLELINEMIPEYWRNSLRSNNKKLKSYLQGHKFKEQVAQEMLQTLKGAKKIQKSIPKIGPERVSKVFLNSKNFSFKSKKIDIQDGQQTMRQFHKSLYQDLTLKLRARSLKNSKNTKINRGRNSINHHSRNQMEYVKEDEKKVYQFCKDLQSLDKIDQQIYKKNYDTKKRWINEGFDILN